MTFITAQETERAPMSYILYSYPDCASHVVRMVLEELGLPYRDEIVDMGKNAQHDDEFLRLNPRGLVPVLADLNSDAVLAETGAILNFLADQNTSLAPSIADHEQRAQFLQRLYCPLHSSYGQKCG